MGDLGQYLGLVHLGIYWYQPIEDALMGNPFVVISQLQFTSGYKIPLETSPGYHLDECQCNALEPVGFSTCTSDTWSLDQVVKISSVYQISDFHEWHLAKWHTSALSQVIPSTGDHAQTLHD